ncbi:glycerophosphodiester phosphodiesterase family protein, partial [Streptomyces sp. DT225]
MTRVNRARQQHPMQHPIQVIAHRGASDDAPEHTLAAYRKAIEDGADALECDVRLTADGHLVCVHDLQLAIETKHPTRWAGQVEDRLLHLLKRFELDAPPPAGTPSPVRVMSFSARSLHRVRAAVPHLPTVYLMQFVSPRLRDGRLPAGARVAG